MSHILLRRSLCRSLFLNKVAGISVRQLYYKDAPALRLYDIFLVFKIGHSQHFSDIVKETFVAFLAF